MKKKPLKSLLVIISILAGIALLLFIDSDQHSLNEPDNVSPECQAQRDQLLLVHQEYQAYIDSHDPANPASDHQSRVDDYENQIQALEQTNACL